ncbi:MAG: peptidase M13 [Deferribacteres bacterium]|nr:peptidase M13 [candidate division KSB1 bacterium]MCB9500893.1 peptidase M13 [Deferribacteres bacterium]
MRKVIPFLLITMVILFACEQKPKQSGIELAKMDTEVRPQDDYYRYMNGTWLNEFEIPADKSVYGSFEKLYDEAQENLRIIIDEAGALTDKAEGSTAQKVGDMYASYMDSVKLDELGITPVQPELDKIKSLQSKADLVEYAGYLETLSVRNLFSPFIDQDQKNSTQYIVNIYQSGLSLPDRDYYLKEDQRFVDLRADLVAHIEKMFDLAGIANSQAKALRILEIEKMLAENHWTRVENRDPVKTYNKMALADLNSMMPNWDWNLYANTAGFGKEDSVNVNQPSYLKALDGIFAKVSLEDWKTYYTWRVLTGAARLLSNDFVVENFNMYRKKLRGIQAQRPRWERGVGTVQGAMGELVGKLYVERYFKPAAKERMKQLVENLKYAMKMRIENLDWMSDATKVKALEKLSMFNAKIGYPDEWKDYSELEIKKDDLFGNVRRASLLDHKREIEKLGKPIDRNEWHMTPQTVNAYYNSSMNEVVFPAAILQPPFFNMEADDAVNYGGIGAVIGHEITHGFDDSGRQYNGDGNLEDWWTEEDGEEFVKRANLMVEEYNAFNPIDTMHVNGKLTLGENVADLGGLTVAFHAYKRALSGKEAPVIDGLTGDERFFLGWAQVWGRKYRDEALRERLITDPHSPSEYRTNGIVSNMPEFYKVYQVKEGDKLFRPKDKRVKIW